MKNFISRFLPFLLVMALFSVQSCVDQDFDEPPSANVDPALEANTTIEALKNAYTGGAMLITNDVIIKGIVTADDRSGNTYKEIIMQDETGGISISVDMTDFYSVYPIGRRVFVKCKGLYLYEDNGGFQLGTIASGSVGRIPLTLIGQYLFEGQWGLTVEPKIFSTPDSLTDRYQNVLIQLDDVEFETGDAYQPYADAVNKSSINRHLQSCNGSVGYELYLYTSGFSNFAGELTPCASGSVRGIYKFYSGDKEIIIRNTSDVMMSSPRCDGVSCTGGGLQTIRSVRDLFTGTPVSAEIGARIQGVVISDIAGNNIDDNNVVLQQGDAGIVVRFSSPHSYILGDQIEVNISGAEISEFNGWLQVNNVTNSNAKIITGLQPITPRLATISDILANFETWESTLVTVADATLSPPGSYSGNKTITDNTGNMVLYTRSFATFSNDPMPGGVVDVIAMITHFNNGTTDTKQLQLRNTSDVQ